jgi:hypothetical protein
MTYTTSFSLQFAQDFARFPVPDQLKVTTFLTQFESFGLQSFSNYPGKIAPSWSGPATAANHAFARNNDLWHYHIGIPKLKPTQHGKYFTSDWLLHFQWPNWRTNGTSIHVVDLLPHTSSGGTFNLPKPTQLP